MRSPARLPQSQPETDSGSALKLPLLTLLLASVSSGLQYGPLDHALLYFDRAAIGHGELWRLLTGHFIHADTGHLTWNLLALIVLGFLLEQQHAWRLLAAIMVGVLAANLWLLSPFASIDRYCGFSGVLNSLLVATLWQQWRQTRQPLLPLIGILALAKIAVELNTTQSLFTTISWPPYPAAHLAGFIGGLLLCGAWHWYGQWRDQRCQRFYLQHS